MYAGTDVQTVKRQEKTPAVCQLNIVLMHFEKIFFLAENK